MIRPFYLPGYIQAADILNADACHDRLKAFELGLSWLTVTDARKEFFIAKTPRQYTYGSGRGVRTYESALYRIRRPDTPDGLKAMCYLIDDLETLNKVQAPATWGSPFDFNGCFLNRYDAQQHQLGWHADDSPEMDHAHPIAVVSLGAEREIWWREKGTKGLVPPEQRQRLGNGSLFMMPPGFQKTHEHRIPKADHEVGMRISLTYRRFL